jgi:nitroimidazol reductase NimA-like FMN-containing flavoprotein (pyridoxamine 5'-phosphate oxidase superfamily)
MTDPTTPVPSFPVTEVNRVRRVRERGKYDEATVHEILDRGFVAHVAFIDEGKPVVIPMIYGRDGNVLYLHGARKGRFASSIAGQPVCVGVTLVDGIVVARSLFESSMNYRSVTIHGMATEVVDPDARLRGLRMVSEHNIPGRWEEVRAPFDLELKATVVLSVPIEEASAKVRAGGPIDDYDERDLSVWVGVVPVTTTVGDPVSDPSVPADVQIPASVQRILRDR